MTEKDYPALWKSSTETAASSQARYLLLFRAQLALLAVTAFAAAWAPADKGHDRVVSMIITALMLAALVIGIVLRLGALDDAWFRARAFAENAKAAAWRFMVAPQEQTTAAEEAKETAFLEELKEIRGRFPQIEKLLSRHPGGDVEITPLMKEVRGKTVAERLQFYVEQRLNNQLQWYSAKAKTNAEAETNWSTGILVIEGIAVLAAGARVVVSYEYNPTGAVAALAACFVAWTQSKRFSDLANTYGVARVDLTLLKSKASHVHNEEQFQALVEEVEEAVSREHRLWIERRSAL